MFLPNLGDMVIYRVAESDINPNLINGKEFIGRDFPCIVTRINEDGTIRGTIFTDVDGGSVFAVDDVKEGEENGTWHYRPDPIMFPRVMPMTGTTRDLGR